VDGDQRNDAALARAQSHPWEASEHHTVKNILSTSRVFRENYSRLGLYFKGNSAHERCGMRCLLHRRYPWAFPCSFSTSHTLFPALPRVDAPALAACGGPGREVAEPGGARRGEASWPSSWHFARQQLQY